MSNNQCDGCLRWIPIVNGKHKESYQWWPFMCTAHLYFKNLNWDIYNLWITKTWLYAIASQIYIEYLKEKTDMNFVEWCNLISNK